MGGAARIPLILLLIYECCFKFQNILLYYHTIHIIVSVDRHYVVAVVRLFMAIYLFLYVTL